MAAGVQRPFLKWAGGKFRVLPHILQALPDGKRLIEPFVGSGALFLNTDYRSYQLADINPDLINLYQTLQKDGANFIDYVARYFTAVHNQVEKFYQHRERFNLLRVNNKRQQKEKAALFLYLNRHGYNGLCRYNSKGLFNVPFGRFKLPYFPVKEMLAFHLKAQTAEFVCADFRQVMAAAKRGDVVYCDPPYVPLSRTASFTAYAYTSFTAEAQQDLANAAARLSKKQIPVLISNHDTNETRLLYQQAAILHFPVRRFISCNGTKRLHANELLAHYAV
ncbi:Dam family site-specific DNA-(adenine-N6)-methyltransferase [Permianibacter aggregans]|uniref:Site-specific DNA-methyltransferase (adenine-specific) n=1 Tax=Permianibacter aggregans TaxID=1510150 RepID=A0A4V3D7V4_9GAMM|nr:Dam family site-specific DNA-(adenine-N6)-methyltransferase [Permianibacter aggregans]TDQ49347.1 DNA adenine methylase Dam [Permianibacter aggregans]